MTQKIKKNHLELLLPAGDMQKLKTAIRFGADAVYLGTADFGLRAHAGNFDLEQLRIARQLTREADVALFLTLNASLRPDEFPALDSLIEELKPLDLDAYIIA
ncbi:MAG: peptidase U32, partial [Desulfobacterales bacterium]|nr:peptidase U32 [Desulfobacterales bacterium]